MKNISKLFLIVQWFHAFCVRLRMQITENLQQFTFAADTDEQVETAAMSQRRPLLTQKTNQILRIVSKQIFWLFRIKSRWFSDIFCTFYPVLSNLLARAKQEKIRHETVFWQKIKYNFSTERFEYYFFNLLLYFKSYAKKNLFRYLAVFHGKWRNITPWTDDVSAMGFWWNCGVRSCSTNSS